MYIEPNTIVHVLRDIPIGKSYDNTIYWNNKNDQYTYFYNQRKYTYDHQTYQRAERGYIRVRENVNNLYDCNYLMYQNTAYINKWFYAFIKSVNYINDNVTEIEFEIDDVNTWLYDDDVVIEPCFVQREHSVTDNIGDNLVQENFELGDYVGAFVDPVEHTFMGGNIIDYDGQSEPLPWRSEWVIVLANFAITSSGSILPAAPAFYGAVAHQCEFKVYDPSTDSNWVQNLATDLVTMSILNTDKNVANIFMYPKRFLSDFTVDPNTNKIVGDRNPTAYSTLTKTINMNWNNIYGFIPKNAKLYTYPYCFLKVDNGNGSNMEYKWERFDDPTQCTFVINAALSISPSMTLIPLNYKNIPLNLDERLPLSDFPVCTHATNDAIAKIGLGIMKLGATAIGAAVGGPVGGYLGFRGTPTNVSTEIKKTQQINPQTGRLRTVQSQTTETNRTTEYQYENEAKLGKAIQSVGQAFIHNASNNAVGDGNSMMNLGAFDFTFERIRITDEYARLIDSFFSMYGYATNTVKVPNISSRPAWNYVKTTNCNIHGKIPADVTEHLQNIFNDGITFWKNPEHVGDYTQNNSPIQGGN